LARYDDQCKWLLRGHLPSRSQLYAFRDRVEPFLDDWHRQLIQWALHEGITTARCASLDGTFVAALASRHQLLGQRRLDRRLLLLQLLVWLEGDANDLPQRLESLPALALSLTLLTLQLLGAGLPAEPLLRTLSGVLLVGELLGPEPAPLPAWVPRS